MSHIHSHSRTREASSDSRFVHAIVGTLLGCIALTTLLGLAVFPPDWNKVSQIRSHNLIFGLAEGTSYEDGVVKGILPCDKAAQSLPGQTEPDAIEPGNAGKCVSLKIRLETGPEKSQTVNLAAYEPAPSSSLRVGTSVQLLRLDHEDASQRYSFAGTHRVNAVLFFVLILVASVLVVARWKGFLSLLGLFFSIAVIVGYIMPALASGANPLGVGLAGSSAIMFVVVFLAHGISLRTSAAMLSTFAGISLAVFLGNLAVWAGHISGFTDDTAFDLSSTIPGLNLSGIWVAATVLAGLGVLNDVTITQASAVWELRLAAPSYSRRQVFSSAMFIGRDHIASTIYTIVFAYVGGSFATVMLIVMFFNESVANLFVAESLGAEVLRILASASALVLTVPLTTAIACLMVKPAAPETPSTNPVGESNPAGL